MNNSDAVEMPHLPSHHFPILPDSTEIKFEHGVSHKRCTIRRKQVPIELGFAMTVHKAQGQTMSKVIVDLAGCSGTEPPYVMASRATSLEGLLILRSFERKHITKRRSEELRKEFSRLMYLKWKTVADNGDSDDVDNAMRVLAEMQDNTARKSAKRKIISDVGQGGKCKKRKI